MSLVNQVLQDLQARRGDVPEASGLTPALRVAAPRAGQRWGLIAVGAVVVGIALVIVERVFVATTPDPAAVAVTATEPPIERPVVAVVAPEPVESIALEEPVVAQVEDELLAAEPEPEPEPERSHAAHEPRAEPAVVSAAPPAERRVPAAAPVEGDLQRTLVAETPQQRGADAFAAGVRALSEGRRATAETEFRLALSHDASLHDARLALANLLAADGRVREAEANLQEGLRIAPQHAAYAERYARILFERGDLAGAIGVMSASPPPVEASPGYHALRAALLQRAGLHDDAADAYGALVDVRPDNGLWWMGLAISLEGAGRTVAAHDAYARAARDPRLSAEVARFVHERLAVLDHGTGQ